MGTPFMIDDAAIESLRAIRADAEANPITEDMMLDIMRRVKAGTYVIPQQNRDQTVELPFGFTVSFTVEWQPMGMSRHMSMASPATDRVPLPIAAEMVMEHLGYDGKWPRQSWLEDLANGGKAINIVEVIEPHPDRVIN